ncbi:uncharacterized protein LOC133190655 [Saccostrea echinata]|uniref:uncharacterized protein LOC133190655 n=1 Tax=Saccostrea echinata TaxID=191078 RepID=UPI002A7ED995|nr:uncharacterized protein LOC133190655 [Saccostrea echinata]
MRRGSDGKVCENETKDLTLQGYEAKSLKFDCDITGTHINSSEKLIVYTASVPVQKSGKAEYLVEQLLPITLWGTYYVIVPAGDRPYGNIISIVTAFENTTIHISGYDFVTIPNKYDRIQRRVDPYTPLTIRASKNVSVMQTYWYNTGNSASVYIIPLAFKTDIQRNIDDIDYLRFTYTNISYSGSEYVPLSNYFLYRNQSELPTSAQGCTMSAALNDTGAFVPENFGTTFVLPNPFSSTNIFCEFFGNDFLEDLSDKQINVKQQSGKGCEDLLNSTNEAYISFNSTSPVIITANRELSLLCRYRGDDRRLYTNTFIVPPVDILSTEYMVTLPPEDVGSGCILLSLFDNTSFAIPQLNMFETVQGLQQKNISSIKSGMFIVANKVISVLCYSYNEYIMSHPLPSSGTYFKLIKSENFTEEELIIASTDGNTVLTFEMAREMGTNYTQVYNNASMKNMGDIGIHTWAENISFFSITANKPVIVAAYFKQNDNTSNSKPYSPNRTNFVYVPPTLNETLQGIYLSRSGWPYHFRMSTRKYLPTSNQLFPGDKIDNDQDGLTDEESCLDFEEAGVLSDLDLDGSYREDCKGCSEGEGMNLFFSCEACDFGLYRESRSWNLTCQSCGENYTTYHQQSSSQNDCIPVCTEGTQLKNYTLHNETKECEPCPVGSYKNTSPNDTSLNVTDRFFCIPCPVNKTTYTERTVNFTECIDICEAGFELQHGNSCAQCEIGFYKNISSVNTTASIEERWNCTACRGYLTTLSRGTVNEEDCIEHCSEGRFWNGSVCLPCPVGEYKNTSSENLTLSSELRWNCTPCEGGKTTYSSGTVNNTCIEHCEEGRYLADNGTCVRCEIGSFKNTSSENVTLSENLRWNCTKCPDGKTTSARGSFECVETCKEGEEYNKTTKSCDKCKIGTYKNVSGNHIQCFECPANYTTRQPGKTRRNDCKKADCRCPCNMVHPVKNYTSTELEQIIQKMKKELEVNKEKLSSNIRKRISVMDDRPSARSIGAFGAVIIIAIFIALLALDIVILLNHFSAMVGKIKNFFARK